MTKSFLNHSYAFRGPTSPASAIYYCLCVRSGGQFSLGYGIAPPAVEGVMPTEHMALSSPTRTITVISLLLCGSHPVLGQAPPSEAAGQRESRNSADDSATRSARVPAPVDQAIRWLPDDTETIIVSRGPLDLATVERILDPPEPIRPPDAPPVPKLDFRQLSLIDSTWMFHLAGHSFLRNLLQQRVRCVATAGREFGPPFIGGQSTFEGCQLILFENAVPDVGVRPARGETIGVEIIENNRIVRVDTKWGGRDDPVSVYYAKPRSTVLIAATNVDFLRTMLQRMAKPTGPRSPLLDFPEWKHVDTRAPVWGIRHRRTATRPFYLLVKGNDGPTVSQLVGMTFSYQPQPQTSLQWHFRCTHQPKNVLPRIFGEAFEASEVSPFVAQKEMVIREKAEPAGWSPDTPSGAVFTMEHFMGYLVCP